MYKQIIAAIDASELAAKALEHALSLARYTGAKLRVVTVTEASVLIAPGAELLSIPTTDMLAELEKAAAAEAAAILETAKSAALVAAVEIETEHVRQRHPADGIIEAAQRHGADLIVMGSHGRRGLGRLLLGSQATEVLARSTVPVLIVK
jgi:nucleotide-binding universal stress UspA family protein